MRTAALIVGLVLSGSVQEDPALKAVQAKNEGKFKEGLALYLESFTIRKSRGASNDELATVLKGAADCARGINDWIQAEDLYRQAAEYKGDPIRDKVGADIYFQYHEALRFLGRFSESYAPLDKVIEFHNSSPNSTTDLFGAYLKKAENLFADQRYAEHLTVVQRELIPYAEGPGTGTYGHQSAYRRAALGFQALNKSREAIEYQFKSITVCRQYFPNSPILVGTLIETVPFLRNLEQPDLAKAIELLNEASEVSKSLPEDTYRLGQIAWQKAEVLQQMNRGNEALPFIDEMWTWYRRRMIQVVPPMIALVTNGSDPAHAALSAMKMYSGLGKHEKALDVLQQVQGRTITRLVLQTYRAGQTVKGGELSRLEAAEESVNTSLRLIATLETQSDELETEIRKVKSKGQSAGSLEGQKRQADQAIVTARAQLAKASAKYDETLQQLRKKFPVLLNRTFTLSDVSSQLKPGELYVSWFLGAAPIMSVVLVRPDGSVKVVDLSWNVFKWREEVNKLREKLLSRNPSVEQDLRRIYLQMVPAEIRREVEGASGLVVTPDGPLWELPFSALLAGPDNNPYYLGLAKPIAITPSLSLFGLAREASKLKVAVARPSALVIGDPDFGGGPVTAAGERSALFGGKKPPSQLPGARLEAGEIAKVYGTSPVIGEAATEQALRTGLKSAQIVHVGTHGYVNNDYPMASGLLLAAPKRPPTDLKGDGALMAWEVLTSKDLAAQLVVLSACETGLGRSLRAEGVDGLIRSFQIGGVPSVVSSLWKVDDSSTQVLMQEFHSDVKAGKQFDVALMEAMRKVFANPQTRAPYYWAPFFLVGENRNRIFPSGTP